MRSLFDAVDAHHGNLPCTPGQGLGPAELGVASFQWSATFRLVLTRKAFPRSFSTLSSFFGSGEIPASANPCRLAFSAARHSGAPASRGFVPIVLRVATINYSFPGIVVGGGRSPQVSLFRYQSISRRSIRSSAGTDGPEGHR